MAARIKCYDETGFEASNFVYASTKDATDAYNRLVKQIDDNENHELHQTVALEVDGKEVKRYPATETAE